jgi:putative transposase
MHDELFNGRHLWVLTVVDTWSRVCPDMRICRSATAMEVIDALEQARFSRSGKPTDNAYVESFNATVRLECLGRHWFLDLDDAREKVEEWRAEYNEVRPHSAIGDRTPSSLIHLPRQHVEALTTPKILS